MCLCVCVFVCLFVCLFVCVFVFLAPSCKVCPGRCIFRGLIVTQALGWMFSPIIKQFLIIDYKYHSTMRVGNSRQTHLYSCTCVYLQCTCVHYTLYKIFVVFCCCFNVISPPGLPGIDAPPHSISGKEGSSGRESPRYCWCCCWGVGSGCEPPSTPSVITSLCG